MSTLSYAVADSATMQRRNLRYMLRYPSVALTPVALPVIFLLLFVYVFGGTLGSGLGGSGLGGAPTGRAAYVAYVVPGILMMAVAAGATGTAISVATDMTEGIIARFRTMAIARVSVLTGHVLGSLIQTMLCLVVVTGVALLVGFRPDATAAEWLATAAVLAMITFALTWLSVALGLAAKTVESASNLPTPLVFLPFLGSGFVPTDSMPGWLRAFAEYQSWVRVAGQGQHPVVRGGEPCVAWRSHDMRCRYGTLCSSTSVNRRAIASAMAAPGCIGSSSRCRRTHHSSGSSTSPNSRSPIRPARLSSAAVSWNHVAVRSSARSHTNHLLGAKDVVVDRLRRPGRDRRGAVGLSFVTRHGRGGGAPLDAPAALGAPDAGFH